jgi:hypothetical protein
LDKTEGISRPNNKVFLSIKQPYKEIGVQHIAKDTLWVMELAGIDVSKYKAHSTRMAAASKALDSSFSVDEVMKQGR